MLFAIQDLQFTLGSLLLEGYPAFGARCACAGLLLAAGLLLRHWLQKWLFPHLARLPLPKTASAHQAQGLGWEKMEPFSFTPGYTRVTKPMQ